MLLMTEVSFLIPLAWTQSFKLQKKMLPTLEGQRGGQGTMGCGFKNKYSSNTLHWFLPIYKINLGDDLGAPCSPCQWVYLLVSFDP